MSAKVMPENVFNLCVCVCVRVRTVCGVSDGTEAGGDGHGQPQASDNRRGG